MNDPWEGIFIPSLNQPLDVNGDGNYDAYFYDTDKIADEKYAAIGVYVGTNKSNVLNVKPVQGGYLMEYNYAGRSWPARQYLYPIPEVVIQFNTNLSQNPGWYSRGYHEKLNYSVYLFIYFLHRDIRTTEV